MERIEQVRSPLEVKPVGGPVDKQGESLDQETQGALLRLARFLDKEKEKEKKEPETPPGPAIKSPHPYQKAFAALTRSADSGQILDTYA